MGDISVYGLVGTPINAIIVRLNTRSFLQRLIHHIRWCHSCGKVVPERCPSWPLGEQHNARKKMNCNRLDTYASWRAVYWCNGNSVEMTRRPWSSRQKDSLQGWADSEDIPYLWACLGSQCVHHYVWFVFYILITVSYEFGHFGKISTRYNSGPSQLIHVTVIHKEPINCRHK